jgi:DnaJ domain
MSDYSRHYAVLRITSDTDWKALRARYRQLIGRWHPDRFPAEGLQQEMAEEHSKQITIAYQALERYYRDHGVLPPMGPPARPEEPTMRAPADVRPAGATAAGAGTDVPREGRVKPVPGKRQRAFVMFCSVVAASIAAYYYSDEAEHAHRGTNPDSNVDQPALEPAARSSESPSAGGISEGSTLGEVYAIQGIPTSTQGDTWHYGKSTIRFSQGKVVSWTQHPDNPLRIARDQPIELREGVFDVGSTKNEVRAIQGAPVSETETVWDYGTSRVYFDHNRVVRWETSPLQPLRVPR